MHRTLIAAAILALAAAGLASCTAKTAGGRKTIGVNLVTSTNPFFKEIADAMTGAAAPLAYEVQATYGEYDPARQKDQVKDFLVKKVAAIVLSPCDSRSIGTAIADANAAGIPVFTVDLACMADNAKIVTHIATDNREGGRLAGKTMVELLGGKGKVAIIDYPEVESVIQRTTGFHEVVDKEPGIEIIASLPGGGDKAKARAAAQDVLQAHQDLDAFFCINDPSALGTVAAIEQAGRAGKVKVIGFDGQPEARRAIRDGKLHATILQHPTLIGQKAVDAIARYMKGERLPAQTLIPTEVYKREDALKDPTLR